MTRAKPTGNRGFTLVEIIVILLLLGLATVTVLYRVYSFDADLIAQTNAIKNHMRYGQLQAMRSNAAAGWGVKCDGTYYWLFEGLNPDSEVNQRRFPAEDNLKIALAGRKVSMGSFLVKFDSLGRPCDTNLAALNADLTITVTSASTGSRQTITVTADTGFVP